MALGNGHARRWRPPRAGRYLGSIVALAVPRHPPDELHAGEIAGADVQVGGSFIARRGTHDPGGHLDSDIR